MFTVFSKNNNTFGPAFYYPLLAADKGYIGLIASNSPAQMAVYGGKEKMLGTNPFSVVIPVPGDDPIIIDMATSVVAKSKFKEYKEKGMQLPEGWALDEDGKPTSDPEAGICGFVQPMSGFKGIGIAMIIDILSSLSGSAFLNQVGRFYSESKEGMNVGYYISVIDPAQIYGENYSIHIREYVKQLRNSAMINGEKIVLPGDNRIAHKNEIMGENS